MSEERAAALADLQMLSSAELDLLLDLLRAPTPDDEIEDGASLAAFVAAQLVAVVAADHDERVPTARMHELLALVIDDDVVATALGRLLMLRG
jgi:hypothetical protein